jgi:hypothetical protein
MSPTAVWKPVVSRETVHDALVRFDGHADHLSKQDMCPNDSNASHWNPNASTTFQTRSHCLVNHLHLLFIHSATVHLDFRDSRVDLTKISRRELKVDGS